MNCSHCASPLAGTKVINCREDGTTLVYCTACARTAPGMPDMTRDGRVLLAKMVNTWAERVAAWERDPLYRATTPPRGTPVARLP